jgi:hypothetical protein
MFWWLSIALSVWFARVDEVQALIESLQGSLQQLQQQLDEVTTSDGEDEAAAAAQAALDARLASEQLARSVRDALAPQVLEQELIALQGVAPLSDDDRADALRVLQGRLAALHGGVHGDVKQDDAHGAALQRLQQRLGAERAARLDQWTRGKAEDARRRSAEAAAEMSRVGDRLREKLNAFADRAPQLQANAQCGDGKDKKAKEDKAAKVKVEKAQKEKIEKIENVEKVEKDKGDKASKKSGSQSFDRERLEAQMRELQERYAQLGEQFARRSAALGDDYRKRAEAIERDWKARTERAFSPELMQRYRDLARVDHAKIAREALEQAERARVDAQKAQAEAREQGNAARRLAREQGERARVEAERTYRQALERQSALKARTAEPPRRDVERTEQRIKQLEQELEKLRQRLNEMKGGKDSKDSKDQMILKQQPRKRSRTGGTIYL